MEKETKQTKERNGIVLLILGVATVLVALIGATFAYFTATINKLNGDQSVVVSTKEIIGVEYAASETLSLIDVVPGAHAETTFTISNPNAETEVEYGLKFVPVVNDFTVAEGARQLIVTITGGALTDAKELNYTDSTNSTEQVIVDDVVLAADTSHEYSIRVDFIETNSVQNTNQKKNFAGYVAVIEQIYTAAN